MFYFCQLDRKLVPMLHPEPYINITCNMARALAGQNHRSLPGQTQLALSAQEFPKIVQRCTNLFPRWEVNQISQGLCTAVTLFVHSLFAACSLVLVYKRKQVEVNKQCNCSAQSLVHFPSREQTCTFAQFLEILGYIELTSCENHR